MPSLRILLCLPLVPNTQLSMFSGSSKHSRTDMFAVSLGYAFQHMATPSAYIAASFRHMHGVRLLGRSMQALGFALLDWTAKAAPPPGLTPLERRQWMDTDSVGGQVFAFCREACLSSHLLLYFGESGQDAGVEVGMAHAAGVPVLGIRGPLEGPGLMLHGAVDCWVEGIEDALALLQQIARHAATDCRHLPQERDERVRLLCRRLPANP